MLCFPLKLVKYSRRANHFDHDSRFSSGESHHRGGKKRKNGLLFSPLPLKMLEGTNTETGRLHPSSIIFGV